MVEKLSAALDYAKKNQQSFLNDLREFISIPSISTDPATKSDIQRAAQWIANRLHQLGASPVEIFPTAGHPVVFGEMKSTRPSKPTVLIYGHYDVQPVEPLEQWISPAFEATQRGENLYGRGASDMKGQIIITLKAIESLIKTSEFPVNLKFLIEGEEEIGSPNLESFINAHKELLVCDFAFNPDSGMIGKGDPTITYGLRGLVYFELLIFGPTHDLHSGSYGGIVHNPAQALCELVAGMHDNQGRVTLPGFYQKVRSLNEDERKELERLPMSDDFYLNQTGAPTLFGERGFSAIERIGVRPTLEVNGLLSGFTGEGVKTVIPAKAMAKISMRLVPDQDPDEIHQQLLQYLETHTPPTVRFELKKLNSGPATITNRDHYAILALSKALESTWSKRPTFKREGGSIPVVALMQKILGVESVISGFGLPDDNLHAPNEKIHLPTFYRGIEAIIRFFYLLGEDGK